MIRLVNLENLSSKLYISSINLAHVKLTLETNMAILRNHSKTLTKTPKSQGT